MPPSYIFYIKCQARSRAFRKIMTYKFLRTFSQVILTPTYYESDDRAHPENRFTCYRFLIKRSIVESIYTLFLTTADPGSDIPFATSIPFA